MSLIYVPLEHLDNRYTKHLDRDISYFFMINDIDYIKILNEFPQLQKTVSSTKLNISKIYIKTYLNNNYIYFEQDTKFFN